jgi:hypothetical protein
VVKLNHCPPFLAAIIPLTHWFAVGNEVTGEVGGQVMMVEGEDDLLNAIW